VAEVVEFLLYQFSCEALSSNPSTTTKNEALSSNLPVPPTKMTPFFKTSQYHHQKKKKKKA
jgi:hypothetical protein